MNKISLFIISFGLGAGTVATVIGIANGDIFLIYVGLICFISNLVSMTRFLKDVIK
jgi:hypothetical protein